MYLKERDRDITLPESYNLSDLDSFQLASLLIISNLE